MPTDLPPQYDPKSVESAIYKKWLDANVFHATPDARPNKFSIVIPPPNVTGALHLGHAINGTIQDVLTRYHRMKGDNTLWMPGIDHAGIATQAVVEKTIFEREHKSRHDLGRDELVRRIWQWKEQFGTRILNQLQSIGSSCDWARTRFTLDDICAKAVREAFFKMFKDGLIFRGKRLVNWDTHLQTAVADDEIYHEEVKGQMTSIKYPIADPNQSKPRPSGSGFAEGSPSPAQPLPHGRGSEMEYLIVATTRPETMLGDTAVAVHPDDPRYKHLIGQHVIVPLVGRKIPIIADGLLVDPAFGTGVVKVTPAHDPNDYATGQRHNLEQINLLTPDGKVNDNGQGEFLGQKYSYVGLKFATAARKQVLEDLETLGLIADKKPHEHEVGHSDRSKTPIEPYLSDQWFVRMGDITPQVNQSEPRPSGSGLSMPTTPRTSENSTSKPTLDAAPFHSNAIAYFITFHTYTTWLRGDAPGAVDDEHNIPGTDFIPPDPRLVERETSHASQPPVQLSLAQRQSVARTVQEVAAHRNWTVHALNVRSTHVHLIISGTHAPERMMNDMKSYATRRLREASLLPAEGEDRVWSRHGSTRYLWNDQHVSGAIHYTLHEQGENAPDTTSAQISEPRPSGSGFPGSSSHTQPLPHGRGSDSSTPQGITLADGTRAPGLAQAAIDAVTSGRVKITPDRYAKGYIDWLTQKRDWCISRQLWWGHRIPVWTATFGERSTAEQLITFIDALAAAKGLSGHISAQIDVGRGAVVVCARNIEADALLLSINNAFDDEAQRGDGIPNQLREAANRLFGAATFTFTQDPDVLDTWFSSALWPISTMGWPNNGTSSAPEDQLLPYFYPTSVLSTAREILTLWVARMVIFGLYCRGEVPFKDVYIHAIIQDGEGRPMKKTVGNGVDPVDIVHSHGADALRFTLASMATETQDIRLPVQLVCPHCQERIPNNINGPIVIGCPKCKKHLTRPVQTAVATAEAPMSHSTSDRFDIGRNFANKIWNAARYILTNIGDSTPAIENQKSKIENLEDRWILSRLNATIQSAAEAINAYRFADLAESLRTFFWTDLCDWYLEISKSRIKSGDAAVQSILLHCLETSLKLLHPLMPFITEELWSKLPIENRKSKIENLLVITQWPVPGPRDPAAESEISTVQEIVSAIREIQNRYPAAKGKPVVIAPRDESTRAIIESSSTIIESLCNTPLQENKVAAPKPANAAARVLAIAEVFIGGVIDKSLEIPKLAKRKAELEKLINGSRAKLNNEAFVAKAPAPVVAGLRDQLAKLEEEQTAIERNLLEIA